MIQGHLFRSNPRPTRPMRDVRRMANYGVFSISGSPSAVEALSLSGIDWVCIDSQHGPLSYLDIGNLIRAAKIGGAKAIVRVGGPDDRYMIQQSLDQGADGIMVPLINTAEEATRAISYCLFPPYGVRSAVYPSPAAMRTLSRNQNGEVIEMQGPQLLSRYIANADGKVEILLQIETKKSLDNLDEILAVDNYDGLFLGPADLALSLGLLKKHGDLQTALSSSEMAEINTSLVDKCKKRGIKSGSFAFGKDAAFRLRDKGFDDIGFDVDISILGMHCSYMMYMILNEAAAAKGDDGNQATPAAATAPEST